MLTRIAADARARSVKRRGGDRSALSPRWWKTRGIALLGDAAFAGPTLVLLCPTRQVHACAAHLVAAGATAVTVSGVEYVFEAQNPLDEALSRALSASRG